MPNAEDAVNAVRDVAAGKAVLIDCRRDDEWDDVRAEGAVHWPLARLQAGQLPDIAPETRIYVHCAAGQRAEEAKDILLAHGFVDVINIGGLNDWQRAGGEVHE
jgi:rhodanese-related sulfurtransferase